MGRSVCAFLMFLILILSSCADVPDNPKMEIEKHDALSQSATVTATDTILDTGTLSAKDNKSGNNTETLIASLVGFKAPIPDCTAEITVTTDLYSDGIREWKEYAVQVCDLLNDPKRIPFGDMIGSQRLGQGTLWHSLENRDDWQVIEYRAPRTPDDIKRFHEEGIKGLEFKIFVSKDDLPLLIQALPFFIQKEILAVIMYPHGGLEILPLIPNEATAKRVLVAVQKILKKNAHKSAQ